MGHPVEVVACSNREVTLCKIRGGFGLSRIPNLLCILLLQLLRIIVLLSGVAQLEVRRFDLLGLNEAGLFGNVFSNLFRGLVRLALVIRVLLVASSDLAACTVPQGGAVGETTRH